MTPLSPNPRHTAPAGFTLVEVLVALLLVALALGAGMRASATLTREAQRQPLLGLAQICADNQLVALRLSPVWLPPGERETPCQQLQYEFTVRTRLINTPNPSVMRLEIQVQHEQHTLLQWTSVMGRY